MVLSHRRLITFSEFRLVTAVGVHDVNSRTAVPFRHKNNLAASQQKLTLLAFFEEVERRQVD